MIKISLRDVNSDMVDAFKKVFIGDKYEVQMVSIVDIPATAVVSPANSFGFMDGGVDWVYTDFFGETLQKRVQTAIHNNHGGELMVGQALYVPTENTTIPFLICAPTMRVPKIIKDPLEVYLATRAAMRKFLDHLQYVDQLTVIAFPGMGTGCGRVPPIIAAKAMMEGIEDAMTTLKFPETLSDAMSSQRETLNRIMK